MNLGSFTNRSDILDTDRIVGHRGTSAGGESGWAWSVIKAALEVVFAPKASPAFTGSPTAPTASPGTATTQIATTAFVSAAIAGLGGGGGGGISWVSAPAGSTSAGSAGQAAYDGDYLYVCVATNTWRRTGMNDW